MTTQLGRPCIRSHRLSLPILLTLALCDPRGCNQVEPEIGITGCPILTSRVLRR